MEMTRKKIKVNSIKQTCGACPSQWEGETDDKKYVYVRYRWGVLRVDVDSKTIYGEVHGDSLDGYLAYDELIAFTGHLFDWPEYSEVNEVL